MDYVDNLTISGSHPFSPFSLLFDDIWLFSSLHLFIICQNLYTFASFLLSTISLLSMFYKKKKNLCFLNYQTRVPPNHDLDYNICRFYFCFFSVLIYFTYCKHTSRNKHFSLKKTILSIGCLHGYWLRIKPDHLEGKIILLFY